MILKRKHLTENEWKDALTPEAFHILREKGTEPPFSGKYVHTKEDGTYICAGCGNELFSSKHKFDSGSGWPSFTSAIDNDYIIFKEDLSLGTKRTEVICAKCGGHLGHVFTDGPRPTGRRFCINSAALDFKKQS